jgi:hypothetical protein
VPDDFSALFHEPYFEPSDLICGDESMSKLNGLEGYVSTYAFQYLLT